MRCVALIILLKSTYCVDGARSAAACICLPTKEVAHERMDVAISIVVTFLLTLANGYFSMSELAVVSAKRAVLEPEADEGDRKARAALDLGSNSEQFLATIQVAITLVGFASSAFASTSLSDPLGSWFMSLGVPASVAVPLAPILITLAVSYLSIVVGELVPKRIALADAERMAKSVAGPIRGFMRLRASSRLAHGQVRERALRASGHQVRRRARQRLRGGDQVHGRRRGRALRPGEVHDP